MTGFHYMEKNYGGQITSIEISNISGESCAIIPEWIINEMGWYEDTKLSWKIDDANVIIHEQDECLQVITSYFRKKCFLNIKH